MKKYISIAIIIILTFVLTACGESQEELDAIEKIDEIGEVTLESEEKIIEAEKATELLSVDEQEKLENITALHDARAKYDKLKEADDKVKAEEKEKTRNELLPLFTVENDKVEKSTYYMPKSLPEFIDTRSYIIPYIGVKNGIPYWFTRYNYTGEEWIFWDTLTILVDGETYIKNIKFYDTVRDNDTEIWEWYDDPLPAGADFTNKDLKMLREISDSKETIIRFAGDDYYYDLVVTEGDKKTIKDTLNLYETYI